MVVEVLAINHEMLRINPRSNTKIGGQKKNNLNGPGRKSDISKNDCSHPSEQGPPEPSCCLQWQVKRKRKKKKKREARSCEKKKK